MSESADTFAGLAERYRPDVYREFLSHVGNHVVSVLHDDGLYRHVRFADPDTLMYSFDLVTWPGHLSITGDIGTGLVFQRHDDMFAFFDSGQADGQINAGYWAEKLSRCAPLMLEYSPEKFLKVADEMFEEFTSSLSPAEKTEARASFVDEVVDFSETEVDAMLYLAEFGFGGRLLNPQVEREDFTDYTEGFILQLHAILWGIKKFNALPVASDGVIAGV